MHTRQLVHAFVDQPSEGKILEATKVLVFFVVLGTDKIRNDIADSLGTRYEQLGELDAGVGVVTISGKAFANANGFSGDVQWCSGK